MANRLGFKASMAAAVMVGGSVALVHVHADDTKTTAKAAFARLKTMAGDWKAQTSDEGKVEHADKAEDHKREGEVIFKLTGAGSAVVETQFPGSNHEMVSVYHLDGDDLRMTHYCAAGNQPHVKLDREHSRPDELIFIFDGGTNLDPSKDMHIHGVKITFHEDGKVTSAWEGYVGGKKAMTTSFLMSRQSEGRHGHQKPLAKPSVSQ